MAGTGEETAGAAEDSEVAPGSFPECADPKEPMPMPPGMAAVQETPTPGRGLTDEGPSQADEPEPPPPPSPADRFGTFVLPENQDRPRGGPF